MEVKKVPTCVIIFFGKKMGKQFPQNKQEEPMGNDTITAKNIQYQIKRFTSTMTNGMHKPKKKFISEILFGIQASRDIKLSNISRSLSESIKLIKTENRLSRNMTNEDFTEHVNNTLITNAADRIKEDTVLALDLSDIRKNFAKKMDYLTKVWDGSKGEVASGYWICEIIGAGVNEDIPIPLYSELYSHIADGFQSENKQIIKAIESVNIHVKGKGIWTMDRGADRRVLVDKLGKMRLRFVIRIRGDRYLKDSDGIERSIPYLLKTITEKVSYSVTVDKEGYTEEIPLSVSRVDNLTLEDTNVSLVVVEGFSDEPMLLITNVAKSPQEILEIYLTRWKCEESFRFLKHEYHLEDIRVRRYTALRNTIAFIHAVFYFLSVYLGRRLKMKILLHKILEKAQRFFQIPSFNHYAIADGIFRLLFNSKWTQETLPKEAKNKRQLLFGFL